MKPQCWTTHSQGRGSQEINESVPFLQDVFYNKVMADDSLNYFFEGVNMKAQRAHQVCNTSPPVIISFTASS